MNNENFNLAAEIAKNAADEETAIQGYYEILPKIMDKADQDVIKEIISDEKNHAMLLAKMMLKYDSNIVMAED
jgi:rubrerythrin